MPTNQELEAMCEQAFPPELAHLMTCPKVSGGPCNCDPFDNNEPDRSKALALAIEVRDKTERETRKADIQVVYEEERDALQHCDFPRNDTARKLFVRLRSLLSEAQK